MPLKPEVSIPTGLATAGVVYGIYQVTLPRTADIQALPAGTRDIDTAERRAAWLSTITVASVSLLAKDPTIFVMGAAAVIGMNLVTAHANWTEGATGAGLLGTLDQGASGVSVETPEMGATTDYPAMVSDEYAR